MSARPYPLMEPTPTGHQANGYHSRDMRAEFRFQPGTETIDATDFIPGGSCINWTSEFTGRTYMQPHGVIRS